MLIDLTKPDLRSVAIRTRVKTSKGFIWYLIDKDSDGERWIDETSQLKWLPIMRGKFTHHGAMKLEDEIKRLPTKEDFKLAEKHGIREILDMSDNWFWSSSVYPSNSDYAYDFSGSNGDIGYGSRSSFNGAAVCVAR